MQRKLIVAVTGASGAIYAKNLLDKLLKLKDKVSKVALLLSNNGKSVWKHELGNESYANYPYQQFDVNDFFAPVASGSCDFSSMVIIPCSMGTLGRIANGASDNLIIRAADVMLKEKRKLILVTRETPLNLIHIENMKKITLAGGVILPASPSFYSKPNTIEELVNTITERVLSLVGIEDERYKWGDKKF